MARTPRRIWRDGASVYLRFTNAYGEDRIREFWAPPSGGYVREITAREPGTQGRQVCRRLASLGPTLSSTPEGLEALIRREYAAILAAARREEQQLARYR